MARSNSGGNGKAKKVTRVRKPVGVLAPGARFNSSTGKITPPKKSAPKRSGVFARGLPAPIPKAPKGLVSSPRVTKVTPSGQRSVDRYTKGTVEWNLAHALAKTPVATTRRQLEREERRQERLIKSVTGKPRQVELRTGVWTGGKVQRFEGTALGSPGKGRSPSIIQGNLASRDPQIVKAQKTALAQRESVRAGLESNALNERKLPFRKGYKSPGPPALQAAKVPGVLKPRVGVALPKRDPRKSRLAQRMNENIARKELRVLKSKKKPIARRAKAADNLRELKIISGESERQAKVRKLREVRQAVAEGNRVSFDSGYKTKGPGGVIKAVGEAAGAAFDYIKPKSPLEQAAQGDDIVTKVAKAGGKVAAGVVKAIANETINAGTGFAPRSAKNVKASGFRKPKFAKEGAKTERIAGLTLKVPGYAVEAIANDPETQIKRFAKDAAEMIKSVPAGVIMAVDKGPETVWQQLKKDYVRRYGALVAGRDKEFRDRLEEQGVTSEVLDSFAVISIVGGGSSKVLQAAATAGKGTGLARRIATRTVAKDGRLVARKLGDRELLPSGNFYGNVARKVIDDRRGRGVAKRQRLYQEAYSKNERGEKLTSAERRNLRVSTKDENTTVREDGGSTPIRTGPLRAGAKTAPQPSASALPKLTGVISHEMSRAAARLVAGDLREATGEVNSALVKKLDKAVDQADKTKTRIVDLQLSQQEFRTLDSTLAKGEAKFSSPIKDVTKLDRERGLNVYRSARRGTEKPVRKLDAEADYFKSINLTPEADSLAKAIRDGNAAEVKRLTPIVDKQSVDSRPVLSNFAKRAEDKRVGRQAESVSTIFDNAFIGEKSYTRRAVAKISSHEFVAMRLAQKNLDKMFRRELKILSQEEKDAFFYAMSLGIRTPEQARKVLPAWRDRILSERKASEAGRTEAQINRGSLWTNFNEVPKIEALIANPEAAFTPALARFTDIAYKEARRTGKLDPALNRFQMALRERNVQGQQLGVKIEDYAVDAANPTKAEQQNWLRAVEIARKEQGLSEGGFFRGEMRNRQQYAVHAVGGSQAVLPDKQFKGILAKYGAGNTDPEVFVRGLMSNIKRAHNWNKVALVYDAVASKLYRNMSMDEIMAAVDAGDLDPSTFALWNPRKYRVELDGIDNQIADAARYSREGERELGMGPSEGRIDVAHPEDGQATVHEALSAATLDGRTAMARYAQDQSQFADTKWTVVPKGAHKEIMASTKPSNAVLRGFGIAQGKFSRVLLANPVWLQFQIASNAFLTGLVDGTGPIAIIKAQKWWYGLPPEVRNAVEPYVGIHRWYDDQNKLGAAEIPGGDIGVGRMSLNGLVDAYRGLKETPYWNANNNPLTMMFRADNAQNNFFRRAVLYNSVKREAYRNMGRDMGQIKRIQAQVMDSLKGSLGDKEAMLKLLTNQKSLERHAEHLDSLLGNWMTYTNAERRVFSRFTMFYGFLRFSTKLTFYTMPIHHPVMSSILAKLGQLQRDELRRLFGVDVPFWEIGNYYGTDGWLVPKGMRLQAARINPFFNAYGVFLGATRERPAQPGELSFKVKSPKGTQTYATKPEWKGLLSDDMLADMTQFMPPYFGMALDQVSEQKTSFGRKPWTVNGNPAQQFGAESTVSGSDAVQVLFNGLFNLSPYWRALEQSGIPGVVKPLRGKQTSDSSILFPNPVQYAGTTKASRALMKKNQTSINREGRKYQETIAGTLFSPVLGTEGQSKIDSARSYAKDQANKTKKKKKAKKAKLWTVPK